ncbi:MAG TPA: apolipoprotein N-acyltransferase [Candidatus Kapabacteria bacterium]|nr:apolipoprotein N-acyltransferase [Candidatus Kapabacteria bacterium]
MLSRRNRYLLAILSGLLLGLAFPPTGLAGGLLAFIALVPLLFALEDGTRLRHAFKYGWVAMFVLGLVANYWVGGWKSMSEVDPFLMVGGVLLAIVHPFFLVVPWLLYDVVRRRVGRTAALYSLPIFQAGFEYAHSFGDLAYPWLNLYNTQTYNLPYDQFIEWTGPYLLSVIIVLVNVEIFQVLFPSHRTNGTDGTAGVFRHSVVLVLLVLLPYLYGAFAMGQHEASHASMRVTIVQPNIDPWAKWYTDEQRTLDTNFDATLTALRACHDSTDLILWPETAITFYITTPAKSYELGELYKFIATTGHPLLTGFPDREDYVVGRDSIPPDANYTGVDGVYYRSWNAAMLVYEDSNGRMHREVYHKQKLVPLGEHIPFVEYFPFLGRWFQWNVGIGSWNYGEGYEPLKLPLHVKNTTPQPPPLAEEGEFDTLRITPTICYESIYPSFVRHFVEHGANLLAVITNDGWYGRSSGPYQHEQFAVLRAIENRRWIVRSANTGISAVIDDRGRILKSLPLFISGSITARVPLIERKTLYVRWGDFIAIPAMLYGIIVLVWGIGGWIFLRRRKKRSGVSSSTE